MVRPDIRSPYPEFYLGRIDVHTLAGMGHRDARKYLATMDPSGLPKDSTCTAMTEPAPGVRFNDTLRGELDGSPLAFRAAVVLPSVRGHAAPQLTGYLEHARFGRAFLADGQVETHGDDVSYRARIRLDGGWQDLSVTRTLRDDPGPDAWADSRRARLEVGGLVADLTMSLPDAAGLLASVEPVGAHGFVDRADAVAGFAGNGFRELLRRYGPAPQNPM